MMSIVYYIVFSHNHGSCKSRYQQLGVAMIIFWGESYYLNKKSLLDTYLKPYDLE